MTVWKLTDVGDVLRRIDGNTATLEKTRTSQTTIDRRIHALSVWDAMDRRPPARPWSAAFLSKMSVRMPDHVRWGTQMGQYVRWTTMKQLGEILHPDEPGLSERLVCRRLSRDRNAWDGAMILAYHSSDNELEGLSVVGRTGEYPADWFYRHCGIVPLRGIRFDSGLAFLGAERLGGNGLGMTSFILSNPRLAFLLQASWFVDHGSQLPILASHADTDHLPSTVWRNIGEGDRVFWSLSPSPDVFEQAVLSEGRVSFGKHPQGVTDFPLLWLRWLKDRARPWDRALADMADSGEHAKLQTILRRLSLPVDQLKRVLRLAGSKLARNTILSASPTHRGQPFRCFEVLSSNGSAAVWECSGRWVIRGRRKEILLSDVLIRLDSYPAEGDVLFCEGRVVRSGRSYPFRCELSDARSRIGEIAEDTLLAAGVSPPHFDPTWKDRLYEIAKRFSLGKGVQ